MRNMQLNIKNIGPINEANINLGKLNIIGGKNGTGKSTASKLLYCLLIVASEEGQETYDHLAHSELQSVGTFLFRGVTETDEFGFPICHEEFQGDFLLSQEEFERVAEISNQIYKDFKNDEESVKKFLQLWYDFIDDININDDFKDFYYNKLNVIYNGVENADENHKYATIITNAFRSEFNYSPIEAIYGEGKANLKGLLENGDNFDWTLYLGKDNFKEAPKNKYLNYFLGNVIYLDSISPLEAIRVTNENMPYHHFNELFKKLCGKTKPKRLFDADYNYKLSKFQNLLFDTIGGVFESDYEIGEFSKFIDNFGENAYFTFEKNGKRFDMKNSSSGLKQIGIIQMLLKNRILDEGDYLIIDEPEVNLHPEWQVRLAEFYILLIKEYGLNIYLNSHSPHFIEALEVFSVKYGLRNDTHFYMTMESEDSDKFDFKELNYSNIGELYRNLGNAYDEINIVRIENEMNGL